jgi:hypothetical protein
LVGQQTNEQVVIKKDLSSFRTVKTGDAIEEGRLASPIGSDDAVDGMFFYLDIQITHGNQSAEAFRNFSCGKNSHKLFLVNPLESPSVKAGDNRKH